MSTYIIIGVLALVGIIALSIWNSKQKIKTIEIAQSRTEKPNREIRQEERYLKLTVMSGFDGNQKTISENTTSEVIKKTMQFINWNEFHMVQLEDLSSNGFKALHVSGSLAEDGLASGLVTDDDHILMTKPIKTVDQMTEILLDFLKGEDVWRNKYKYK